MSIIIKKIKNKKQCTHNEFQLLDKVINYVFVLTNKEIIK